MPTTQIEDGTLWYDEQGSGPPLVFLHGGWQNVAAWGPQVDHFADDYRVIRFDLRGHGRTGATDRRRYSIDLFVDDLEALLDHLDVDRPILVGLSIGGMVVQSYLDRHPAGARAAVVAGPVQSMPPVDVPPLVKPFVSPVPAVATAVRTAGTAATFRSLLAAIRATTGGRWLSVDPAVRSAAMDALEDVSPAEYVKIFRALYEFVPPDLSSVETPTLVVAGDREAPPVKVQGERLARTLPNGTYRELADAGHLVNQDAPAAFNAAVTEFLAALESPGDQASAV